ncbi:9077_t:CDS:2, partial [Cetraspora pellucida]
MCPKSAAWDRVQIKTQLLESIKMQQQTYNGLPPEYTENRAGRKFGGWENDSHMYNGYNFNFGNLKVNESNLKVQMAFVRKVFSILFAQISMSAVVAGLMMHNNIIKSWVQSHGWIIFVVSILTFVLLLALQVNHRSYPTNFVLLAAFTLAESYTVGTV